MRRGKDKQSVQFKLLAFYQQSSILHQLLGLLVSQFQSMTEDAEYITGLR